MLGLQGFDSTKRAKIAHCGLPPIEILNAVKAEIIPTFFADLLLSAQEEMLRFLPKL